MHTREKHFKGAVAVRIFFYVFMRHIKNMSYFYAKFKNQNHEKVFIVKPLAPLQLYMEQ
jgi:hypothetical protein